MTIWGYNPLQGLGEVAGFMLKPKPIGENGVIDWGVFDGQHRVGTLVLDDDPEPPHERWFAEVTSYKVQEGGTGSGDSPESAARVALGAFREVWEKSACYRLWQLGYEISMGQVRRGPLSSELKCDFVMWFRKLPTERGSRFGVLELSHDGSEWTAMVVADGSGPLVGAVHSSRMVAVEAALHRWGDWVDEINEARERFRREMAEGG